MGRLPVTVGLWFSLGHSSIVVGATIAIVISVSAIDKIPDVSAIGGVIGEHLCRAPPFIFRLLTRPNDPGVSVSASFLFLLGKTLCLAWYGPWLTLCTLCSRDQFSHPVANDSSATTCRYWPRVARGPRAEVILNHTASTDGRNFDRATGACV